MEYIKENNKIYRVEKTEIDLKKLQREIDNLKKEIEDTPDELLVPSDKENLEEALGKKMELLQTLKKI